MQNTLDPEWFTKHDNLILLTHYLADHGSDVSTILLAVEKPWHFQEEFEAALEQIDADIP